MQDLVNEIEKPIFILKSICSSHVSTLGAGQPEALYLNRVCNRTVSDIRETYFIYKNIWNLLGTNKENIG